MHFAYVPMEPADTALMLTWFGEAQFHLLAYERPRLMMALPARARRKALRLLRVEAGYLWGLDDWYDDGLQAQLHALDRLHRFDAVLVEYVFMSKAFEAFSSPTLKVLDTHDRFALRHRAYLAAGQRPQWFSITPEDECLGLRRADVVLAIQDNEAAAFRQQLRGTATSVITLGHILDLQQQVVPAAGAAAVFLGSANSINIDAASYFVREVLPRVRARRPGFALVLAGDVCDAVPNTVGVVKLGRVADVKDAFALGALAVNPVRVGTGINIKLLESLAAGLPNVCTLSGARGLERHHGRAMLVVPDNDPAAMARAIESVLSDPRTAAALASAARQLAVDWNEEQTGYLRAALRYSERPS